MYTTLLNIIQKLLLGTISFFLLFPPICKAAYLSPVAMVGDANNNSLYIAENEGTKITVLDISTHTLKNNIPLPEKPTGIVLSPNEAMLYITTEGVPGKVYGVDLFENIISEQYSVGHTPVAPTISNDGRTLFVCNQFDNNISVINLKTKEEISQVPVLREPTATIITQEGQKLFIANFLPYGRADTNYSAAVVSVLNISKMQINNNIPLPNGSSQLRGICISPDGQYVYVSHVLARYNLPTTQLQKGWMNTNAISIIDIKTETLINTVLLDDYECGAANPWGIACSKNGKWLCVSIAGTDEVIIIDRPQMHDKLNRAADNKTVTKITKSAEDVPNDLSFLTDIRHRFKLGGKGPRSILAIDSNIYVLEYFSDTISKINLSDSPIKINSYALGPKPSYDDIRKGEILFNDANLCFQKWQSCSSCHPGGARVDGLNWDLLNDGMGNPKNTKSLLLSHKTPPVMSLGVRDSAETAVKAGFRHIEFALRPSSDTDAIDNYLKSLEPIPSPYLINGQLTEAAKRGKIIFKKANCSQCHFAPLYTDKNPYNVGTGRGSEKDLKFDTPTLIEIWRTAPYLYDGRAITIKELLTTYNQSDQHGKTSDLTEEELNDLVEYVLSL